MASACIEPYTWHTPPESQNSDLSPDFEFFRLEDPSVTMLPADELFSDGKLKPISTARSSTSPNHNNNYNNNNINNNNTKPVTETPRPIRVSDLSDPDPYAFSPRAPTCSIRWKNILKLKKLSKPITTTTTTTKPNPPQNPSRSLIGILNRVGSKPTNLKDSDTDSVSTSSRLSLSSSSSSSGHDHDDSPVAKPATRARVATPSLSSSQERERERVLADSPRLNSSGKVVFERSSSSPGSFTGGPRHKHSGRIERSYSAHVRVAPVLNVPVKFGFPLFSSSKRDLGNNNSSNSNARVQRRNSRSGNGNRIEQA